MKRNIELIRDFIKFVENDMKEKYDYYDKLKQPVPQEELKNMMIFYTGLIFC